MKMDITTKALLTVIALGLFANALRTPGTPAYAAPPTPPASPEVPWALDSTHGLLFTLDTKQHTITIYRYLTVSGVTPTQMKEGYFWNPVTNQLVYPLKLKDN